MVRKKRLLSFATSWLLLSLFANPVFSDNHLVAEAFKKLRKSGVQGGDRGELCEHLARLEMASMYPPNQYQILMGVKYHRRRQSTLGELDLVVWAKNSQRAVAVAEVKCSSNLQSAKNEADRQLKRFQRAIDRHDDIEFEPPQWSNRGIDLSQSDFNHNIEYYEISQKGGEEAGFDVSLRLTLEEVTLIEDMLFQCMHNKSCDPQKLLESGQLSCERIVHRD